MPIVAVLIHKYYLLEISKHYPYVYMTKPHFYSGALFFNKRDNNRLEINVLELKYLLNYLYKTLKMSIFVIDE